MDDLFEKYSKALNIKNVVVWGYRKPNHSHHFIHKGFFETFQRMGFKTHWLDNKPEKNEILDSNTLVIGIGQEADNLSLIKGVKYCIHNPIKSFIDDNDKNYLILQVITSRIFKQTNYMEKLVGNSYFSKKENCLYQAWGTPIHFSDFLKPKLNIINEYEFFVGSIWDNEFNQGNIEIIKNYKKVLKNTGIKFVHCKNVSDYFHRYYIRQSAVSCSIVGEWQKTNYYIPCRIFKAISFGKIGSINTLYPTGHFDYFLTEGNIESLINKILNMPPNQKVELIKYQQNAIRDETYFYKVANILESFLIKKEL